MEMFVLLGQFDGFVFLGWKDAVESNERYLLQLSFDSKRENFVNENTKMKLIRRCTVIIGVMLTRLKVCFQIQGCMQNRSVVPMRSVHERNGFSCLCCYPQLADM